MFTANKTLIPVLAGGLLLLGGCGSAPPIPVDKIASVETAIASAKDKEATTLAAVELHKAEKKLAEAKELANKGEEDAMEQAKRLLDQALVDAKLAASKADAARTAKQKEEMKDSVDTLKKEVDRH